MALHEGLLRAFNEREIHISVFLEMLQCLNNLTGSDRVKMQDRIAATVEMIYPYREGKEPEGGEHVMDLVPAFQKVVMEREIPIHVLAELAEEIWNLPREQQNAIREQKAKEFAEKYPDKRKEQPLPRIIEND